MNSAGTTVISPVRVSKLKYHSSRPARGRSQGPHLGHGDRSNQLAWVTSSPPPQCNFVRMPWIRRRLSQQAQSRTAEFLLANPLISAALTQC